MLEALILMDLPGERNKKMHVLSSELLRTTFSAVDKTYILLYNSVLSVVMCVYNDNYRALTL